jgi:hypothetical protein
MRKPTRAEIRLYAGICLVSLVLFIVVLIQEVGFDYRALAWGVFAGGPLGFAIGIPLAHVIRLIMLGGRDDRWSRSDDARE